MKSIKTDQIKAIPANAESTERTRTRLLKSALQLFGRSGYDGASTRAIAEAAGANIQAINYYFGGKEGLYLAPATYLGETAAEAIRAERERASRFLATLDRRENAPDRETALAILRDLSESIVANLLSPESAPCAQFVFREQMIPTAAYSRLHDSIIGPISLLFARIIAVILGEPNLLSHSLRLRALSFMGGLFVFRYGDATMLGILNRDEIAPRDMKLIKKTIGQMVTALARETDQ